MQIRSQEQIIHRRIQENTNNSIITELESEKEKLIEDNVTLIRDNCIMKDKIKEVMKEVNSKI